ncbi:hypothetical protein L3Y34_012388 [Caenorhabditis briggsae]|uniref:Uncharacterized protein n=1 Tax=Caenorhabditis briggsae TaxID=6238 RepID=A0AAE8ZVL7_CAEBR|nr:hypothetical protein L3Y34_012388 [Caenorhabditis briggsae]
MGADHGEDRLDEVLLSSTCFLSLLRYSLDLNSFIIRADSYFSSKEILADVFVHGETTHQNGGLPLETNRKCERCSRTKELISYFERKATILMCRLAMNEDISEDLLTGEIGVGSDDEGVEVKRVSQQGQKARAAQ